MKPYQDYIGQLIDWGLSNQKIMRCLLRAAADKHIALPVELWAKIDRYRIGLDLSKNKPDTSWVAKFNQENPLTLFVMEAPEIIALRQTLKNPAMDLRLSHSKVRAGIEQTGLTSFADLLFPSEKTDCIKSLGIVSKTGRWSEERFQKIIRLIGEAEAQNMTPNFALLRLWANDMLDLSGKWRKQVLPFDWVLDIHIRDPLASIHRQQARRLAALFLCRHYSDKIEPIKDTIRAKDIRHIEKCSQWLCPPERSALRHLELISATVTINEKIDWQRFKTIADFINRHINKTPDPELLSDYLECHVNFEGKGRYHE